MPPWLKNLDEIILIALFVVVPVLQRVFQHLAKQRTEAAQRERARRALETPSPAEAEPAESVARGRERWRELLTELSETEAVSEAAPPAPAPPPPPPPAKPPKPAPVRTIVPFEPEALGGLPEAPTEDELEGAATAARTPLVAIEALDVHEAVEPLANLPGLLAATARAEPAAPERLRGRAAAPFWRRAVVLSELLQPPVSLRAPGTHAPGLRDLT